MVTQRMLANHGPSVVVDRFQWAFNVVKEAIDTVTSQRGRRWTGERRDDGKVWITLLPSGAEQASTTTIARDETSPS